MEIIIKNPEDGMRLAADIGNQLIAEVLYQGVIGEAGNDVDVLYEQLLNYIGELSKN